MVGGNVSNFIIANGYNDRIRKRTLKINKMKLTEKKLKIIFFGIILIIVLIEMLTSCAKLEMYESNQYYRTYELDIVVIDSVKKKKVYCHDETGMHRYFFTGFNYIPGDTIYLEGNKDLIDSLNEVY